MSKKSRSPGDLAFVNVDLGTALARAFARAHEPHGLTVPVNVQPCFAAIAFTVRVSGCPNKPCATLISRVTGEVVKLFTDTPSCATVRVPSK